MARRARIRTGRTPQTRPQGRAFPPSPTPLRQPRRFVPTVEPVAPAEQVAMRAELVGDGGGRVLCGDVLVPEALTRRPQSPGKAPAFRPAGRSEPRSRG